MMKSFSLVATLFFSLFSISTLFGQVQEPESNKPIEDHFEKIIKESSNYKNYEVIHRDKMTELRDHALKKIGDLEDKIKKGQQNTDSLKNEISRLTSELSTAQTELKEANTQKTSISFMGVATEKSSYKMTMWGLVIVLGLLLIFFIYKFRNSNILTKEAQKNQNEIESEFNDFRQKSLEKQQEMGRKLQDERNKRNKLG